MIRPAFLRQGCVGVSDGTTWRVTDTPQRSQIHRCFVTVFPFPSALPTFPASVRSSICVGGVVFVSVWAVGFVGVVVPTPFNYVSHVVYLGAAFEVVWVDAGAVVAFVSDYWRPFEGGYEVGESVDCPVFSVGVELAVAVTA